MDQATPTRAEQLSERAVAAAREGDFVDARSLFRQSLDAGGAPLTAYVALARVELALGLSCEAVQSFRLYLEKAEGQLSNSEINDIAKHIRQIEEANSGKCNAPEATPEVRETTLSLQCPRAGVTATLDGESVSSALPATMPVSAGTHEVRFEQEGRVVSEAAVELAEGNQGVVSCVLAEPPPPQATQAPSGWNTGQKAAVVTAGAGLLTGLSALSVYLYNAGTHRSWKNSQDYADAEAGLPESEYLSSTRDRIERLEKVSIGLTIGASLLAVSGATWFVLASSESNEQELGVLDAQVRPDGGQLRWSATW